MKPVTVRKTLPPIALLCAFLASVHPVRAGDWRVYVNTRFGYHISYPPDVFGPGEESVNGDGAFFRSRDGRARLTVFGTYNSAGSTLPELIRLYGERDEPAEITYMKRGRHWGVVSGYTNGRRRIFYTRIMLVCDNALLIGMDLTYPASSRKLYDGLAGRLSRSLRIGRKACRRLH